jgi:transposase
MRNITTIGLDLAKYVFQVHGADAAGAVVIQRKLRRDEVLGFLATLPPCRVGIEACATAHFWARQIGALGHDVRLIPPAYVKPYVARQKNDAADAAAICEAVSRPTVRTTPIKTKEQQTARVVHRVHELLSRQRVMLINAIRSHMAEFGIIASSGPQHVAPLIKRIDDPDSDLPSVVRHVLALLAQQLEALHGEIDRLELAMTRRCRADPDAARLMTVPGVGPISASAILAGVPDAGNFRSARDFSAWLGLVPRQNSSGGKARLGRITKMGDRSIRRLLVIGAMSVIRWGRRKPGFADTWLGKMMARKPIKVAAVALANKTARIIWAMLARGEDYRAPSGAPA